jgi:peptidoglycan hydrolase CwlO-like protein
MKKFNKTQNAELTEWITKLTTAKQSLDDAYTELEEKHNALAEAIGEYNGVVTEVAQWRDDIVGAMEEYQGERSDKWQEGDAGQQYQSWIDEWMGLEFEEIEVPDLPDAPEVEHIEILEQAPTEADAV